MWKRVFHCDEGSDLVEYGMLLGLIALATIAALTDFRSVIDEVWTELSQRLSG